MTSPYLGLSAEDFAQMHDAIAEAMAFVVVPVTFYVAQSGVGDPLYGETADGSDALVLYGGANAPIGASIKLNPTDEELTKFGLVTGASLLGFIPTQLVLNWQAVTGLTFALTPQMEVAYLGVRYNVLKAHADMLPVGDGSTLDTFGIAFAAKTKPSTLPA